MQEYIKTEAELLASKQILDDYVSKVKYPKLAFDVETYRDITTEEDEVPTPHNGGKVGLMQIGTDPDIFDYQLLIDVKSIGSDVITKHLKSLLESTTLLGHNIKYDISFLMTQYNIFPTKLRDTMIISQVLKAGDKHKHSLAVLYKKFLDYGWFLAETGKNFSAYEDFKAANQTSDWSNAPTEEQLLYAADDVRLIFFLYKAMMDEIDKFIASGGKRGIYDVIKLECALIPEFTMMEIRGLDFNIDHHVNSVIPLLETTKNEAIEDVRKAFPNIGKLVTRGRGVNKVTYREPININSHVQVKEALASLGLNPLSTKEDEIKSLRESFHSGSSEYKAITSILEAKKASSLQSKFGQSLVDHVKEDGRIHPSMHQIGGVDNAVDTGRSSSSNPNIMQIPSRGKLFGKVQAKKLFRSSFGVASGYILGDVDLSQIEPRMTAHITQDPLLIAEFKKPDADLHSLTAKSLLSLSDLPLRGSYERDYIGKTANLAMSYGIGPKKLAKFMHDKTLGGVQPPVRWTVEECKHYLETYYENFQGIKEEMKAIEDSIRRSLAYTNNLAAFKQRKPIYIAYTIMGRPRRWCLTEAQEELARTKPEVLHRDYVVTRVIPVLDEYGEPIRDDNGKLLTETKIDKWNEYNKTINRIAREAYNFRIQGSSADLLKLAILEAGKKINVLTNDPLNQGIIAVVHDEILFRVREDLGQQCLNIVIDAMEKEGKKICKSVPVKAEGGLAYNWAECKD